MVKVSCVFHAMTSKVDQDESVRLWNVHTGICILIFAGAGGHRNEVLSVVSVLCVQSICPCFLA